MEKPKTKIYEDLMTKRDGKKEALGTAAIVCGIVSIVSVSGLVGTYIKADSAFIEALRKGRNIFVGSAIGTGATAGVLALTREILKDRTELLKTVHGDYVENPITSDSVAASYEIARRKEQNAAYTKDEITSAVLFGLSILGIVLANAKGEDTSYFDKIIKEIGPKPFTGAAVVSALSGIVSVLRSWAGNSREIHLINKAFDIENRTTYAVESGDRSAESTKRYVKIKEIQAKREAKAKKQSLPETSAEG